MTFQKPKKEGDKEGAASGITWLLLVTTVDTPCTPHWTGTLAAGVSFVPAPAVDVPAHALYNVFVHLC